MNLIGLLSVVDYTFLLASVLWKMHVVTRDRQLLFRGIEISYVLQGVPGELKCNNSHLFEYI